MRKTLLTLAALALAMTSAKASVVINSTNFPDEALREKVAEYDTDGNGTLSDEEIAEVTGMGEIYGVVDATGLEVFTNLEDIQFVDLWQDGEHSLRSFDPSPFKKLYHFMLSNQEIITSIDLSQNTELRSIYFHNCPKLSNVTLNSDIETINLEDMPKVTGIDFNDYPKLEHLVVARTGIKRIDLTNHPTIDNIYIWGDPDNLYELDEINVSGCELLSYIVVEGCKMQKQVFKGLPLMYDFTYNANEVETMLVENMPALESGTIADCTLGELTLKACPTLRNLTCNDNKLRNLIVDECPNLWQILAYTNRLMWLDLSMLAKNEGFDGMLEIDDQQPSAVAYKLSPTEVGLRVHERMDPARMLNLVTNGKSVTAAETVIDGIRYIVFSNEGVNAESLRGKNSTYEHETRWPYAWVDGNSKDNNLPVNLYISSVTKHPAFIKLSTNDIIRGEYGQPAPAAPAVTRSQDYDGKITFSSSNEKVAKVDPETGVLTVVGAGTATITVRGAETDYRLAPVTSYTVIIEKASPVFAFEQASVTAEVGKAVPENKLNVQMYDGTVQYTISNEEVATVDANGVVTAKAEGEAVITAIGPATTNCNEAQKAEYKLTVVGEGAGMSSLTPDPSPTGEGSSYYTLDGRKVNTKTARKGVVIVNGRKVVNK